MRNILFIMTHLGSGWRKLAETLEADPRIHVFNTGTSYHHPDDFLTLHSQIHRQNNSAAIWGDVILYNKDFTMKRLCDNFRFIFWSSSFEAALPELERAGYAEPQAKAYWDFRMAGLQQYFRRSPKALWNPPLEDDLLFESFFG